MADSESATDRAVGHSPDASGAPSIEAATQPSAGACGVSHVPAYNSAMPCPFGASNTSSSCSSSAAGKAASIMPCPFGAPDAPEPVSKPGAKCRHSGPECPGQKCLLEVAVRRGFVTSGGLGETALENALESAGHHDLTAASKWLEVYFWGFEPGKKDKAPAAAEHSSSESASTVAASAEGDVSAAMGAGGTRAARGSKRPPPITEESSSGSTSTVQYDEPSAVPAKLPRASCVRSESELSQLASICHTRPPVTQHSSLPDSYSNAQPAVHTSGNEASDANDDLCALLE